jgi:hypothetical protein
MLVVRDRQGQKNSRVVAQTRTDFDETNCDDAFFTQLGCTWVKYLATHFDVGYKRSSFILGTTRMNACVLCLKLTFVRQRDDDDQPDDAGYIR